MQEARKLNADVIGYLVFPSHHSPYFEAINVESSTAREDKNINFNYEAQVNRSRFTKAEIIKTKKVEAVDELKEKINKLVILMLAILAADILDIVELTNIRFYLIIAMSILYLLPYYEVIKVFNLELIKNHKENSNKDK